MRRRMEVFKRSQFVDDLKLTAVLLGCAALLAAAYLLG